MWGGRQRFWIIYAMAVLLFCLASSLIHANQTGESGQVDAKASNGRERLLQPNDILDVSVYGETDLTTKVTIDARGVVELPLLKSVVLGGLTLEQATLKVRDLYDRDYLVNPHVTIQMEQQATLRFTVLGQVQRPGDYDFPPNESVSLLQGIAQAGGYTRLANPTRITLQRNVNGELKVFHLDAQAMASDKVDQPFQLQPGDTITVEERVF